MSATMRQQDFQQAIDSNRQAKALRMVDALVSMGLADPHAVACYREHEWLLLAKAAGCDGCSPETRRWVVWLLCQRARIQAEESTPWPPPVEKLRRWERWLDDAAQGDDDEAGRECRWFVAGLIDGEGARS